MPLRIQNKETARVQALEKSIYREPDPGASFGEYVDIPWYHHGQLPLFIKQKLPDSLRNKPTFISRVPTGEDFNKGPKGSDSPCKLNMLDILDVSRHWAVMEDQHVMKGTMAKKFHVTANPVRVEVDKHGTTHDPAHLTLRNKEDLKQEVPVTMLPSAVAERCHEASHSHAPSYHFPMGTTKTDLKKVMSTATADAEVEMITTANDRGHGDLRNNSQHLNSTPVRLVSKRAKSPQKIARTTSRNASVASFMSSGTMMSDRMFASPGLPEEGFGQAGYNMPPMGLPHIHFSPKKKAPKMKPWMTRRGSLTTVKSKGWHERDMSETFTRSFSALA